MTALGIVAVLFLATLGSGLADLRPWVATPTGGPEDLETTIDPNTAAWYELALLPGIGESKAKQIVSFREQKSQESKRPVFSKPVDLEAVRGIGPKTVLRIGRFLCLGES